MKISTKNAYAEVISIIDLLDDELKNKIPNKLRDFFENNKNQNYQVNIDSSISLEQQNLLPETVDILAMLKLNYWCVNEEEKKELMNLLNENEKNYQKELEEKYNIDNLFKNKESKMENRVAMVEYKETFLSRVLNSIKRFFGLKKKDNF